jgi:hypothetical protein
VRSVVKYPWSGQERVVALIILVLSLVALGYADPGAVVVVWQEQRLSVQAENVAFQQLLEEVSRRTGIAFKSLAPLQEPATVHFTSLPLREGLHRLLAQVNYVVVEKATPSHASWPTQVIILGQRDSVRTSDASPQHHEASDALQSALHDADPNIRWQALQAIVQTDETADVQEILEAATHDPEPLIRELAYQHLYAQGDARLPGRLLEDARSADSDRRKTALQFLSQTSASDALPILAEATEDPNIDIQFTAFQQLSSLADAGGLSVIRERLHHPTSDIRLMAIEAMAAHGRAYALEAARATLHDADELVRSKAEGVMHELNSHAEEK